MLNLTICIFRRMLCTNAGYNLVELKGNKWSLHHPGKRKTFYKGTLAPVRHKMAGKMYYVFEAGAMIAPYLPPAGRKRFVYLSVICHPK